MLSPISETLNRLLFWEFFTGIEMWLSLLFKCAFPLCFFARIFLNLNAYKKLKLTRILTVNDKERLCMVDLEEQYISFYPSTWGTLLDLQTTFTYHELHVIQVRVHTVCKDCKCQPQICGTSFSEKWNFHFRLPLPLLIRKGLSRWIM